MDYPNYWKTVVWVSEKQFAFRKVVIYIYIFIKLHKKQ